MGNINKYIWTILNIIVISTIVLTSTWDEIKKPFTYNDNILINPEHLDYTPLYENNTWIIETTAEFNSFGSIFLFFKPVSNLEPFDNTSLKDGDSLFQNHKKNSPVSKKRNKRFRLNIKIYDNKSEELVAENTYEVFHDKLRAFSYPFGFPTQTDSRGKDYKIVIRSLSYENTDPSFMGMAIKDDKPVVSKYYHIPISKFNSNILSSLIILFAKLIQIFIKYSLYFIIFMLSFLVTKKVYGHNNRRNFILLIVLLATLTDFPVFLYTLFTTNLPITAISLIVIALVSLYYHKILILDKSGIAKPLSITLFIITFTILALNSLVEITHINLNYLGVNTLRKENFLHIFMFSLYSGLLLLWLNPHILSKQEAKKSSRINNNIFNNFYYYSSALILNLLLIFTFFYNSNLGLQGDEIFQGAAVRKIHDVGVPLFDSGILYTRGIALSYIGALSYFFTSNIEVATRMPNLIFGLLLLNLILLQFRKYNRPEVVVLTVSILFFNSWSLNILKISRMYLPFVTVSIITLLILYKAIVTKKVKLLGLTLIVFTLGIFVHEAIFMLLPAIALSIFYFYYLVRRDRKQKMIIISTIAVSAMIFTSYMFITKNSTLFNYIKELRFDKIISLQPNTFSMRYLLEHHKLVVLFGMISLSYSSLRLIYRKGLNLLDYLGVCLISIIIFYFFFKFRTQPRYYYPVYVMLTILSINMFSFLSFRYLNKTSSKMVYSALSAFLIIKGLLYAYNFDYNTHISPHNALSFSIPIVYDEKSTIGFLNDNISENDIVISAAANDLAHSFYTSRVDYFLNLHETTPRTTIPHITSCMEFNNLLTREHNRNIYMLLSYSFYPEFSNLLGPDPITHYPESVSTFVKFNSDLIFSSGSSYLVKLDYAEGVQYFLIQLDCGSV